MPEFIAYASVILDVAINKILDYGITEEQRRTLQRGMRVEVPVRNRACLGYVLDIKDHPQFTPVKPLAKISSEQPLIADDLFDLALWMSRYYCAPLRDIFKVFLPAGVRQAMAPKQQLFIMRSKTKEELRKVCIEIREKKPAQAAILETLLQVKKGIFLSQLLEKTKTTRSSVESLAKKGLISVDLVQVDRSPLVDEDYFMTKPKVLNEEQAHALRQICAAIEEERFETHLLYGITGSGKTEVYLQAIEKALAHNKGTIMLVPEISLTAQTIERFRCRFHEKIAILHHRLSQGERHDEWQHIRAGRAKIVIGARSAIFSPVVNLGLIIVDEEHESSYKQNEASPCYQARDVAVMRSKLTKSTIILGSATPSLESYYNAQIGKYTLNQLNQRANTATLPTVHIVDMRKEFEKAKGLTSFSDLLLTGIKKRQQAGELTILFLNRRGYHTTSRCPDCLKFMQCSNCDVPLTFHLGENCLACHVCGHQLSPPPLHCLYCQGAKPLKYRGVGTEQIEKALHAIFPDIRTLRIDADTTRHKGSHQKLLREFGSGKADVLIGTQMIAKGLHFPEVTLVGVLNSDASLNIPDFRASETVFQLITQVAGRSGRGILPGEVIIQTAMPDNMTIQYAAQQDYVGFYKEEIMVRELFQYPPYTHLAKIIFVGPQAEQTLKSAQRIREELANQLPSHFEIFPAVPCGYAKVKNQYRYQFLIKAKNLSILHPTLNRILEHVVLSSQIKICIDIDPSLTFF